jgi:uncharacterized protein YaiE (UPF0345 family)
LSFPTHLGEKTIGVVSPGKWDLGVAKRKMIFRFAYGKINGKSFGSETAHEIKPGERIVLETDEFTICECWWE